MDYIRPKRNKKVAKAINMRLICKESKCEECSEGYPETKLTVDHIIPAHFLRDFGIDIYRDDFNFKILCIDCNFKKRGNFDLKDSRTIPLLKKYADEIFDNRFNS